MHAGTKPISLVTAYGASVVAVAAATGLFVLGRPYFDQSQWALLYLLIVASVARIAGAGPALVAAILSFLAWNFFFLPPYHTLQVADSKLLLALSVFLLVGLVVGIQTARLRDREMRALARERESALIARLSALLVSEGASETMGRSLAAEVSGLLKGARVMLFVPDATGTCRLLAAAPELDAELKPQIEVATWVLEQDTGVNLPSDWGRLSGAVGHTGPATPYDSRRQAAPQLSGVYLPAQSSNRAEGVLAIEPATPSARLSAAELRLAQSLANLVAAYLERQRLLEAAAHATALREADRLKATLLSSVSHELKTPLAALTATVSNLLEGDTEWDEEAVREELRAIVGDVTRLNRSINSLLDLSRLEARAWNPHPDWYDVQEIVATAVETLPVHLRERVRLDFPSDLPPVYVDFVQLGRAFQSLLENAVFYGGTAPVLVAAAADQGGVSVWVEDRGGGVSESEKPLVFEKFYRGAKTSVVRPSGTGLGLAIAREIVLSNGGSILVKDAQPHGARFVVQLPTEPPSSATETCDAGACA